MGRLDLQIADVRRAQEAELSLQGILDVLVAVSQERGTIAQAVVDVLIPVDIVEAGALAVSHVGGIIVYGPAKVAHGGSRDHLATELRHAIRLGCWICHATSCCQHEPCLVVATALLGARAQIAVAGVPFSFSIHICARLHAAIPQWGNLNLGTMLAIVVRTPSIQPCQ